MHLSEVVQKLNESVAGVKDRTLTVATGYRDEDAEISQYAAETVTVLGECEAALEVAVQRLAELEKVGAFEPRKVEAQVRTAAPPLRRHAPPPQPPEEEEIEPEQEGLSDDAINAILQVAEAEKAHEEAMEELMAATEAASTARAGAKREAAVRLTAAQSRVVETWTARREALAFQQLLADRARSG